MRKLLRLWVGIICIASSLAAPAAAITIWNEGTNGDLSNNELAPTGVTLAETPGSNVLSGTVDATTSASPYDPDDFFSFALAAGFSLQSVIIDESFVTAIGGDASAHFSLYAGPDASGTPLEVKIYSTAAHGADYDLLIGSGPQSAGTYTLAMSPVGAVGGAWSVNLVVGVAAPVPEPTTTGLVAASAVGLALGRVRRVFARKPRA